MTPRGQFLRRVLGSPDLRLLAIAMACTLLLCIVDGSMFRTIMSPTIGYRWALVFWLTLVCGWRGLLWSEIAICGLFLYFTTWRWTLIAEPLYVLSAILAFVVARKIAAGRLWLSRERSTLAFLAGAVILPAIPALLSTPRLRLYGGQVSSANPMILMNWLRESAGVLAVTPVLLVHFSGWLRKYIGSPTEDPDYHRVSGREIVELGIEAAVWTLALWGSVHFHQSYGLNVTYLAFLPLLALTLRHGMRLSSIALAVNTVIATTLWMTLHWDAFLSRMDLRLLIAVYSVTILFLAAAVDERKRVAEELGCALRALKDSENTFASVFYHAPLFLFISEPDNGRLLEVNDTFLERSGFIRSEVLGKITVDLGIVAAETRSRIVDAVRQKGRLTGRETILQTKSGELLPCLYSGTMISIGGEVKLLSILEDISERKRAEETNSRLERQLQQAQKMETLGRFSAGIAHDFNNLLTVINGYGSILHTKLSTQPELQAKTNEIRKAGASAATLIEQLLAFSHQRKLPAEVLDLNAIVRSCTNMLTRLVGEEIVLETDLDPDLRSVMATPGNIQQILLNLAANARDAMPHGGVLIIETKTIAATDPNGASTATPSLCAMLAVRDNGEGIAPEHLNRVFEPFFTTKEIGSGTGMGLATVYGLMKQRGGWIDLESELGRGTTFRLFFPAANGSAPIPATSEKRIELSRAGATILLAEDQPDIRTFASEVLQSSGYRVIEASDSAQALRRSIEFEGKIDLLVSDIIMPNMRGPELASKIRSMRAGLPVIFVSGYAPHVLPADNDRPAILLPKPFSPQQLVTAVEQALASAPSL